MRVPSNVEEIISLQDLIMETSDDTIDEDVNEVLAGNWLSTADRLQELASAFLMAAKYRTKSIPANMTPGTYPPMNKEPTDMLVRPP